MAFLGATIPVSVWIIARSSGASLPVAWLVAVWASVQPLMVRLAHSESYYAIQLALLVGAAAVLSWAGRSRGCRNRFLLSVLAAGLLVSQAARIHPTCWVPAATVPLVLLAQPGRAISRLRRTLLATGGIAIVTAATASVAMWNMYTVDYGQQWPVSLVLSMPGSTGLQFLAIAGIVGIAFLGRFRTNALLVTGSALAAVCVVFAANPVRNLPLSSDACQLQTLPALLAAAVACIGTLRGALREALPVVSKFWTAAADRYFVPTAIGVIAVVTSWVGWGYYTAIPTDVMEQAWAMEWRTRLPSGARVAYLTDVGKRVFMLPLHSSITISGDVFIDQQRQSLPLLLPNMLYYRSSLCSSDDGKALCDKIEHRVVFKPLYERDLPARASLPWLPLGSEPVRVGVYLVDSVMQ